MECTSCLVWVGRLTRKNNLVSHKIQTHHVLYHLSRVTSTEDQQHCRHLPVSLILGFVPVFVVQVHREEGLELHLEMVSRQRGHARAGTKTAAMQEELATICSKLSATNARLVIAENTKAKLEQELASEK